MDALRHGRFRLTALLSVIVLGFGLAGCSGDDGNDGAPGAAGDNGINCWDLNENGVPDLPDEDLNGDGVVNVDDCNGLIGSGDTSGEAIAASKVESCEVCHAGVGELVHQAQYDAYISEDSEYVLDITSASSVDNGDGTFTVTAEFTVTFNGAPLNDPVGPLDSLDQKRFYTVEYFDATREYLNSCSLGTLAVVDAANGVYSATGTGASCTFAPETSNAQVYGYIAEGILLEHNTGPGAEFQGSHVHLYDNVSNAALAFGTAQANDPAGTNPDAYESYANVDGCSRCHGTPYLKHGYRAGKVEGIPDFAACKSCHYDDRTGGSGGKEWQYMVDEPYNWATDEPQTADYSYTANIMNDVHMSHAMEFPYPMSMSNCATCHADKLDLILTDEEFVYTTCKSCHAVQGVDAWPDDVDDAGSQYWQEARAPALFYIWNKEGVTFHETLDYTTQDCNTCHFDGGIAPTFSELHTGYDPRMRAADGTKYADVYTASIDDVSVDLAGNTITVTFSANDTAIEPELLVSFYGWDTKNYIVPSHQGDENTTPEACGRGCRFEWEPGDVDNPIFPSVTGSGTAADPYVVTVDLLGWTGIGGMDYQTVPDLIADGTISKFQVTVLPGLNIDGTPIGLNAVTEAFDLATSANIPGYYNGDPATGGNAIVSTEKCNACHEQLGVTFHSGSGRGGDPAMCRNCHNPTFPGSHLEMASRSIENYVHGIHSFQDFDTDDIFNGNVSDQVPGWDPVYTARYNQHINHVFPNFTITNCEACHYEGTFEVPDQAKTMPGVLSASYSVDSWYDMELLDDDGLPPVETASRNISGDIPEYVTGPASRACGGCHRARFINQDEAGALGSWNAHTAAFGTYSENDSDDSVLFGIIDKIMGMF